MAPVEFDPLRARAPVPPSPPGAAAHLVSLGPGPASANTAVAASVHPSPRAPVPSFPPLAARLLRAVLLRRGSDLHCSSFEVPIVRAAGDMTPMEEFGVLDDRSVHDLMEGLAPPRAWRSFSERRDADFALAFPEGRCRLRVNYFEDLRGPGLVCRVIPEEVPDPERLGLPLPVRRLAQLNQGLVLVTGPTGSGKSTTLAAVLDLANRSRDGHIVTLEDPIEFVHRRRRCLVNQREIGTHVESFKAGLRAALREDPDIILVGELRDLETVSLALECALTGHLVFGTLHTRSAIATIDRVVDQFPSDSQQRIRVMLADALKAVVSQSLLKRVGGGRVAALETLFVSPAIANLVREGKAHQIPTAMQTGRQYGQRLMNDALTEMIKSRTVDAMEAYLRCPDREGFIQACKRAGIPFDLRGGEGGEG